MFSMLVENNKDICFYSSKKIFDGWQLGYNIVFVSLWNQSQIDSEDKLRSLDTKFSSESM